MKYEAIQCWAFAWATGKPVPYITGINDGTRRDLIFAVEKILGMPWSRIYRRGGRAIKVTIQQKD